MDWVILIIAGCFESGFAFCLGKMKEVTGAAYWLWGAGFLLCLALSMLLLAKAVKTLPIGTAYPVWTGIGAVGTAIMFCFTEQLAALMNNSLAYAPIKALSFSVVCVCMMSAFRGYTQGCENMVPSAVSQVIEAVFKLVVGLALAWYFVDAGLGLDMGAAGAIMGVTISTVLALGYMIVSHLRHPSRPGLSPSESASSMPRKAVSGSFSPFSFIKLTQR